MTERKWAPRLRWSIFARLLAIMLTMAAGLLLMVTGFFAFVVYPSTISIADRVVEEYARVIAASSPDFETASRLCKRLDLQMRYEGPEGAWTTSDNLPTISQVRQGNSRSSLGQGYHLEPAPNGGSYLFVWNFGKRVQVLHERLLLMLLLLMTGVVFTAYHFQKRLLRPVRALSDGVARLSTGDLDVTLPVLTHDEFGSLTDAFNIMVRRVKQMIQVRDQLLLDVSHELRSPLTRLKLSLAMLPEDDGKAAMAADLNEMGAMIAELLELERLRNGRGLRRERRDLVPILRELTHNFENRAPGIRLVTPLHELWLDIDAEKIRTVLGNILENACKYSLPDSDAIKVLVDQNDEKVIISIVDDGPGIPDADIANIFEPFYRVDRSRSKKTGGYGLGLSICKRIMEAHDGDIDVRNNQGRGASFILTLPKTTEGHAHPGSAVA